MVKAGKLRLYNFLRFRNNLLITRVDSAWSGAIRLADDTFFFHSVYKPCSAPIANTELSL